MIQYTEELDIHIGTNIPKSLADKVKAEFENKANHKRYRVNGKLSRGEIYRSALRMFFQLQEMDPELFYRLRDAELQ